MTPGIKVLVLTLVCLAFVLFALLAFMGKLDRWYHWSQSDNDKPSDQRIKRWRKVFATEILIALVAIVLFGITEVFDKYYSYVLVALAIAFSLVERLWVRKV